MSIDVHPDLNPRVACRLEPAERLVLERIAVATHSTYSEILRRGLKLVVQELGEPYPLPSPERPRPGA